jgi:hypothetical protein
MKKLLFAALITVSTLTSAFAKDANNVSYSVASSFRNDFGVVKDVQWKTTNAYNIATFVENNQRIEAFYDHRGELIGTSFDVKLEELPTKAKRNVASKYADYTITRAIRFENTDGSAYFLAAQKENQQLVLKVTGGSVSVYKTK